MGLNKAMIIGRLGSDPKVGDGWCRFSVATNETWKAKDGGKQEHVEWHSVVCFGGLAEVCGKFLRKGREVFVEGRLRSKRRQHKDHQDVTLWDRSLVADSVQFLGGKMDSANGPADPDSDGGEFDEVPF